MSAETRLKQMDLTLPAAPRAGGNYLPFRLAGSLLFLAGVVSADSGGVIAGTVGSEQSVDDGYAAARACALLQLANIREALGSLDRVESIISLTGYVNAVPGFAHTPQVINGASDLLIEVFGDEGRHARVAVGVAALPRNATVEVQMVVAVTPEAEI